MSNEELPLDAAEYVGEYTEEDYQRYLDEEADRVHLEEMEAEQAIRDEEQRVADIEAAREANCRRLSDKLKLFRSTKELFAAGDPKVEWLVPRFLPAESLISFQGRAKSGKSTFIFHMLKALTQGESFLGSKLEPIKVVYLSEQSRPAFKQQLHDAGLKPNKHLFALNVEDNHGMGWTQTLELALLKMWKVGAKLLIIDSWGRFAQFESGEDEMAPAPTQRRITYLRALMADTGASVLIIQHVSKDKSRGIIDSGMGSSALAQQVDLVLSLSGEPKQAEVAANRLPNKNCRAIQGRGRFSDAITEAICVELTDNKEYVLKDFANNEGSDDAAVTFLRGALAGGTRLSSELEKEAKKVGIGRNKLFEAKAALGVKALKMGKHWAWELYEKEETDDSIVF